MIGYFFWYFPPLKEGAACQSDNFPESDSPACITMEHDVAVNELGVGAGHKGSITLCNVGGNWQTGTIDVESPAG